MDKIIDLLFEFLKQRNIKEVEGKFHPDSCKTYYLKPKGFFALPFYFSKYLSKVSAIDIVDFVESFKNMVDSSKISNMSFLFVVETDSNIDVKNLCNYFNGNSFIHIMYYDSENNKFYYNSDFYYSGDKTIKQIMHFLDRSINHTN